MTRRRSSARTSKPSRRTAAAYYFHRPISAGGAAHLDYNDSVTTGRIRWLALASAALGAGVVGLTAYAQDAADDKRPTLHEDLDPPPTDPDAARHAIYGPDPSAHQNPSAFADKGKILPKPSNDAKKADDEPVHGRGGFAADRDTESRPDYHTGPDGTLHYVTVFNPSVLPFKRMSSMDAVRDDYTLYTASRALEDLPVGGSPDSDRDLFWGSVVVDLKPGVDVPLPSVAPDMRIMSYEIRPQAQDIVFSKDGGDNFFVRSEQPGVSGSYRLVFLADADTRYFGAKVPSGYRVRDLARLAPPSLFHPVPARAQVMAEKAHRFLGVDASMNLGDALDKLVYYFRSFEAKSAPSATGDIFWDLFASQAGVCRHRSFAFMVAANALGIPTRYLTNEAHAWVEVWVPKLEWIRIDLGGAALRSVKNCRPRSRCRTRSSNQTIPKPLRRSTTLPKSC